MKKGDLTVNKISSQEALEIILQGGSDCIIDADSLKHFMENNEQVICYENSGCIVFINKDADTEYVTVVPASQTFDVDMLVKLLSQTCHNPSVLINTTKLSDEFLEKLDYVLGAFLKYEKTFEDLMYAGSQSSDNVSHNVRLLDETDRDMFIAVSSEPIKNRPPLSLLFDIFVNKKQGFILGAFANEEIVGYLSFNKILPNVCDVDYIYVKPEKRKLGIGKTLTNSYVKFTCDKNQIAYWSNAKNAISKSTALSCGFRLIRNAKKYIKK